MEEQVDLVACIRVWDQVPLVCDTVDSIRCNSNSSRTKVLIIVDHNPSSYEALLKIYGPEVVINASCRYNIPNLFGLLLETLEHVISRWGYVHFLSMDYDAYFLQPKADEALLNLVTKPTAGLYGLYEPQNWNWSPLVKNRRAIIREWLGAFPKGYTSGEMCQGGCYLLTAMALKLFHEAGFLSNPKWKKFSLATGMWDDPVVGLLVRHLGLSIEDATPVLQSYYQSPCRPQGLERKGVFIYHPIKVDNKGNGKPKEIKTRNYFRKLRGRKLL